MKSIKNMWLEMSVVSLACLAGLTGCPKAVECGPGTIEQDGTCIAGEAKTPGGNCGSGAKYNATSGQCEADLDSVCNGTNCGVCGEGTTVGVDDAGVKVCEGSGSVNCQVVNCPSPSSTTLMNVCGRIFDLGTSVQIDETTAGKLQVAFYDALAFAGSTPAMRPKPLQVVDVDKCGQYKGIGLKPPATGFIAVGVDDKGAFDATGSADDFVLTGIAIPAAANTSSKPNAYMTTRDLDMNWTTDVGNPFQGKTFSDLGVFVPIFIDTKAATVSAAWVTGAPKEGVKVTASGSPVADANDYYFSDTMPLVRSMASVGAAGDTTGMNGTALIVNQELVQMSGTGPAGCTWSAGLGASVSGVVFVQERSGTCN